MRSTRILLIPCKRCGADFEKLTNPQKYCKPCALTLKRERNREAERAKRRLAGASEIGSVIRCCDCSAEFTLQGGGQSRCSACTEVAKAQSKSQINQRYRLKHGDRIRAAEAEWRKRNPEIVRERAARHKEAKPDARRLSAARYNEKNRAAINEKARQRSQTEERKAYVAEWCRRKNATDPKHNLDRRMKGAVRRHLREGKQGRAWKALVGYSLEELHRHIELQFLPGMTWANMSAWHVDHVLPLASFNYESASDPEFRAAWALTNLRPLWSVENLQKGAKRVLLL